MNPDLKALIQLQEIDLKIIELDKQIQDGPTQIENLLHALEEAKSKLAQLKERLEDKKKSRRRAEQDAEAARAKLSRLKDQLMTVKTNKEYTAMLKEIETCDGEIRKTEDLILDLMVVGDELETEIAQVGQEVDRETTRTLSEKTLLETTIEAHRATIIELRTRKSETEAAINTELLQIYRKITDRRKGIALAEARDECCMACRVRMRPQIFNDVKKNEQILTCDSCGRILYFDVRPPAVTDKTSSPAHTAARPNMGPTA